jgi:hypothetical protein
LESRIPRVPADLANDATGDETRNGPEAGDDGAWVLIVFTGTMMPMMTIGFERGLFLTNDLHP